MLVDAAWVTREGEGLPLASSHIASFYRALASGADPEEQAYTRHLRASIDGGTHLYDCETQDDVTRLLERRLKMLGAALPDESYPAWLRHDGRYELQDGHNRCCVRLARGERMLPLEVVGEHPAWKALVQQVSAIYGGEKLYQGIEHPYFAGWETLRDADRVDCLLSAIVRVPRGVSVDLGCCTGRMSRTLYRAGHRVVAYDFDDAVLRVAAYLDFIFGTRVSYRMADLRGEPTHYEAHGQIAVTVALSLLHHWLDSEEHLAVLRRVLGNYGAHSRVVVVDTPRVDETWTNSIVPLSDVEALYREVLPRHRFEVLGEHDGRRMLALWRTT